jgi:hypothetical protein
MKMTFGTVKMTRQYVGGLISGIGLGILTEYALHGMGRPLLFLCSMVLIVLGGLWRGKDI